MRFYWLFTLFGFGALVVSNAVWSWDESYLFFQTLDRQAPFIPHGRWIVLPPQLAILAASHFTDNLNFLGLIFGGVYTLMPIMSLVAAWQITRHTQPRLFFWVALGFSAGTLVGQIALYVESLLAVQFFWVVWVGILTGMSHPRWVMLFSLLVWLSHPTAIPLFGVALLASLYQAYFTSPRTWWQSPLIWLFWLILALGRFYFLHTDYESQRLSWDILRGDFERAIWGLPLLALMGSVLGGVLVIYQPKFAPLAFMVAGLLWMSWGRDVRLWATAFDARSWLPMLSLPIFALAIWDQKINPAEAVSQVLLGGLGLMFAVTVSLQAWGWVQLREDLQATLADLPPCSPFSAELIMGDSGLKLGETPLSHWSITTYSLVIQGREPQKAILYQDECPAWQLETGLPLTFWEMRAWGQGWFDLEAIHALDTEAATTQAH